MRNFAILGRTFRCNKLAVNIYVHVLKRHSPSGCGFEGSRGIAAKLAEVSMGEEIKVESIWLDYAKGAADPKLTANLTGIAVAGNHLWTVSDEGRSSPRASSSHQAQRSAATVFFRGTPGGGVGERRHAGRRNGTPGIISSRPWLRLPSCCS